MIGHRGACGLYPENTMISFRGALDLGADMIELDVQLSHDGIPVISHDVTVNRCTDGRGFIDMLTFSQIRSLDAGSWYANRFKGEPVPSLEEVLSFSKDKIAVNIEIKAGGHVAVHDIVESTLDVVASAGVKSQVLFSSFDVEILKLIRAEWPDAFIGLLYEKTRRNKTNPVEIMDRLNAGYFNVSKRDMRKKLRRTVAARNYPFMVYTVNRPGEMKKWIRLGAAGIFTNRPDIGRIMVDGFINGHDT